MVDPIVVKIRGVAIRSFSFLLLTYRASFVVPPTHRSANVAVSVVVAPALVVSVFHRSGIETFESFREIVHEAGLILDGRKGGRRSCNKHGGETLF